jgi:hypothetical protein
MSAAEHLSSEEAAKKRIRSAIIDKVMAYRPAF